MSTEELEIEALKLAPQERARLAEKLLESLENLSEDETSVDTQIRPLIDTAKPAIN